MIVIFFKTVFMELKLIFEKLKVEKTGEKLEWL
jgi:hypothetical protein